MPEQFLHLQADDRKEILQTAATQLGQQATVLEKDVWVCWTLQTLFSMPDAHPMAFKGGTSLSKIYGAIKRFSEDVDVTLDYRAFNDDVDPFAEGVSKNAIKKFSKRLKEYVLQYANDVVAPYIDTQLKALPKPEEFGIEVSEDGEKIWVQYPSAIENGDDYLKSSILIEFGGRNVIDPNEQHTVTPDISALVTDLNLPSGEVVVLSPERTFWEKATLIHVECNREEFKSDAHRLSRHWYDLRMLAAHASGKAAINNHELFEDVVRHKQVFFNAAYANYDACLANELRLIPDDAAITGLRTDYEKMLGAGMIYGEPPSFDDIISGIREIEREINTW
ncbi:MAG TPA: nucleotidyl transferase AbiEii/AbiGii toxin family protein [Gammaproteobacteria bacterium]|nr:nucleotidyl transferase AbiEii/AbiGii toxin family protein [Gammaproteobacteria bacterium]